MAFDKNQSAGYLANHMARLFEIRLARAIRPLGLMPAQFMCLLELWREDGRTQRELLELLDVEQATLANTLQRMERDGLISRKPDHRDGRAKRIHLTAKARALKQTATEAAQAVNDAALAGLSDGERAELLAAMRRVIAALKVAETD